MLNHLGVIVEKCNVFFSIELDFKNSVVFLLDTVFFKVL